MRMKRHHTVNPVTSKPLGSCGPSGAGSASGTCEHRRTLCGLNIPRGRSGCVMAASRSLPDLLDFVLNPGGRQCRTAAFAGIDHEIQQDHQQVIQGDILPDQGIDLLCIFPRF